LLTCLFTKSSMGWLWHRRLGHCDRTTWIIWPTCAYHCLSGLWYSTCKPDNPGSLLGVLGEPQIIHVLQLIQDQQWSCYNITIIDTKILTSEYRII
jgi:hypothetical protein